MVGNGAAELIKGLIETEDGTIGLMAPSFDEYRNRAKRSAFNIYSIFEGFFLFSS